MTSSLLAVVRLAGPHSGRQPGAFLPVALIAHLTAGRVRSRRLVWCHLGSGLSLVAKGGVGDEGGGAGRGGGGGGR